MRLSPGEVAEIVGDRAGVVRTSELVRRGASHSWVSRQVEHGHWQRLHRGVLLTHSGPVPWESQAFAALLYAGERAGLSHEAAAFLHRMSPRPPGVIDVTIPADRVVAPSEGLRLHRPRRLPARTGWPLRTAVVDTALDLAAAAHGADEILGWLCEAVRSRASAGELRRELGRRPRMLNRAIVRELLGEVAEGVESPLEGRYHRDVEQAHRLPRSKLQVRHLLDGAWVRADRVYPAHALRIELDGALAHPRGRTESDTWRDNAVTLELHQRTLRYRWAHVRLTPCRTAAQVVTGLRIAEPGLRVRACQPGCPVS